MMKKEEHWVAAKHSISAESHVHNVHTDRHTNQWRQQRKEHAWNCPLSLAQQGKWHHLSIQEHSHKMYIKLFTWRIQTATSEIKLCTQFSKMVTLLIHKTSNTQHGYRLHTTDLRKTHTQTHWTHIFTTKDKKQQQKNKTKKEDFITYFIPDKKHEKVFYEEHPSSKQLTNEMTATFAMCQCTGSETDVTNYWRLKIFCQLKERERFFTCCALSFIGNIHQTPFSTTPCVC